MGALIGGIILGTYIGGVVVVAGTKLMTSKQITAAEVKEAFLWPTKLFM